LITNSATIYIQLLRQRRARNETIGPPKSPQSRSLLLPAARNVASSLPPILRADTTPPIVHVVLTTQFRRRHLGHSISSPPVVHDTRTISTENHRKQKQQQQQHCTELCRDKTWINHGMMRCWYPTASRPLPVQKATCLEDEVKMEEGGHPPYD
jgi:hypothetical protein